MWNLHIPVHNQVTSGRKSLRVFGPKVWNSLPYHIKSSGNLESFKIIIKHRNGTSYNSKFIIQHKTQKDRDCLSKANLGLLKRPGCTTLRWLLIFTRFCDLDVVAVTNSVSGFCTLVLYNF